MTTLEEHHKQIDVSCYQPGAAMHLGKLGTLVRHGLKSKSSEVDQVPLII